MHCRFFSDYRSYVFFHICIIAAYLGQDPKAHIYFVCLCFSDVRRVAAILSLLHMVQFLALVFCQNTFLYTNTP